mmetsp:Transcript_24924/g.48566  ORF Transcript_24924/g.48566 Transcript_24924/m.48566 type:complete len:208 (-) Transcript_24924:107-730(-)
MCAGFAITSQEEAVSSSSMSSSISRQINTPKRPAGVLKIPMLDAVSRAFMPSSDPSILFLYDPSNPVLPTTGHVFQDWPGFLASVSTIEPPTMTTSCASATIISSFTAGCSSSHGPGSTIAPSGSTTIPLRIMSNVVSIPSRNVRHASAGRGGSATTNACRKGPVSSLSVSRKVAGHMGSGGNSGFDFSMVVVLPLLPEDAALGRSR